MRRSHEGLRGIIKDHYLNLPKELEEFNYYYCDGDTGHVIMAIPECLLEEAEKLAVLIENDQEDEIDERSEYATYNFSDFTNEFVSLLRSSGVGEKLGEYIKEHKESFIEKDDENEKRISE